MNYKTKLDKPLYDATLPETIAVIAIKHIYTRIQYGNSLLKLHSARKPPPGAFNVTVNRLTNRSNPTQT